MPLSCHNPCCNVLNILLLRYSLFLQDVVGIVMMKMFYLIVLSAFSFSVFSQSIESADVTDAALKACITSTAVEKGWNQLVDVTELKCHGMNIQSLNGLSAFTALTSLSLYNNNIDNADFSALKNLTSLNVAANNLQQINISGLNKLIVLYGFRNKLKSVNFDGVENLQKMRLMQNEFTHIDVSNLTYLTEAHLFDNQLTDLNIDSLKQLTFLDVRQNPMPDELYDHYDSLPGIVISHDGNADDWK